MRTESNSLKINLGRFQTIIECQNYLIQQAEGKYFNNNEYVLWDNNNRDFIKNTNGSVIILESLNETKSYLKNILNYSQELQIDQDFDSILTM